SGAGTTSVTRTFQYIFRREGINSAIVEGDSFHRYDRREMAAAMADVEMQGNRQLCHFSPEANLLEDLETLRPNYGDPGTGKVRNSLHDDGESAAYGQL